jgi:hypothetical protein
MSESDGYGNDTPDPAFAESVRAVEAEKGEERALEALRILCDVATEAHLTAMAPQWNIIERLGRAIDRARSVLNGEA